MISGEARNGGINAIGRSTIVVGPQKFVGMKSDQLCGAM
jgi:hypothetical protein